MRYPKECPVFEVIHNGPTVRKGAHVEGLGLLTRFVGTACTEVDSNDALAVRIDDADVFPGAIERRGASDVATLRARYGFFYGAMWRHSVRPLTAAARDMLALVRRG